MRLLSFLGRPADPDETFGIRMLTAAPGPLRRAGIALVEEHSGRGYLRIRKELAMEFLTNMVTQVPEGTDEATVEETKAREAEHSAELASQGHLLRLWKPPVVPGVWRSLGLWRADDEEQLETIMATMPLHPWMTVEVTPLTPHPSDPGT